MGPDASFGGINGVIRTRVGYHGGRQPSPTYYNMMDHTESVEVIFDPKKVSYEALLDFFWSEHNPTRNSSRQYMNAVWYVDEKQRFAIEKSKAKIAAKFTEPIRTTIAPVGTFTDAEGYHQKYYLQAKHKIVNDLGLSEEALLYGPLATRLNAYVAGYGTREMLDADLKKELPKKVGEEVERLWSRFSHSRKGCH